MQVPFTTEEIERRLPVWCALSEIYLDTWHTDEEIDAIAARIRATGYAVEEVEHILRDEVAPVFGANLLSIAGEWCPWRETDVRKLVAAYVLRPKGWLARSFLGRAWRRFLFGLAWDWLRIRERLTAK